MIHNNLKLSRIYIFSNVSMSHILLQWIIKHNSGSIKIEVIQKVYILKYNY